MKFLPRKTAFGTPSEFLPTGEPRWLNCILIDVAPHIQNHTFVGYRRPKSWTRICVDDRYRIGHYDSGARVATGATKAEAVNRAKTILAGKSQEDIDNLIAKLVKERLL